MSETPLDPFDPAALRFDQGALTSSSVKLVYTSVPVGRPKKHDFFRTHPDAAFHLPSAAIITVEEGLDRDVYLVMPDIANVMLDEVARVAIYTIINRNGTVRLWPIGLPGEDGRHNTWHASAMDAAEHAKKVWTRVKSDRDAGAYTVHGAVVEMPEPVWPELSFSEMLKFGFKGKLIDNFDHLVLQKLRGQA
jgi:hypothetical protein